ncbi:MAG: T9SS type A sorting domain-containing protein, partial [Lentimicrobium sp.]|nr:T9SS type A sorting domain-containing protein [Lentimicrobium sp.]
ITISDVSGKAIYSSGKNPLSKGINILTIPVSELTKGLYFLRVNSSTFEKTIKFSIR